MPARLSFVVGRALWLGRYWSMGGARPRPSSNCLRGFKKQTTKACLEFLKSQAFVFQVFEKRPSSHRFVVLTISFSGDKFGSINEHVSWRTSCQVGKSFRDIFVPLLQTSKTLEYVSLGKRL
jgi:hypothetical protein